MPWPVYSFHISCNSCLFSSRSDRASSGYQAETDKIFWILSVIFLSFFFLAIQKWVSLFNLFRGLFLPQKKLTKRCMPPSAMEFFRYPCGLKNPAVLLSYQDKKNQKRTLKNEPSKNSEIHKVAILTYLPKNPRFTFSHLAKSCFFSESFRVIFLTGFWPSLTVPKSSEIHTVS